MFKVFEFIFQLGVVFAVFGFLWWLFSAALSILRGGSSSNIFETYILKAINYFFLVSVTVRFCINEADDVRGEIFSTKNIIGALILLMFLLGKIQRKERRLDMLNAMGNITGRFKTVYNPTVEWILIVFSVVLFYVFEFAPFLMHNFITDWFVDSIVNIIDTPVFGFIFKIVGFFFMLGIIFKFIGGFFQLFGLKPRSSGVYINTNFDSGKRKRDKDDFDDYEEMN